MQLRHQTEPAERGKGGGCGGKWGRAEGGAAGMRDDGGGGRDWVHI